MFNVNTLHIVSFAVNQDACKHIYKLLNTYYKRNPKKASKLINKLKPCLNDVDGCEMKSNVGVIERGKLMNYGWETCSPEFTRFVIWYLNSNEHLVSVISVHDFLHQRKLKLLKRKKELELN